MPQENKGSPVIPAGTERTVYGTNVFPAQNGQAQPAPSVVPAAPAAPAQQAQPQIASPDETTFAALAAKKGWTSPDDMAKSYANLESHNTKVEMTASDVLKLIQESAQPAPQQPQVPRPVQPSIPQPQSDEQAIQIVQNIVSSATKPLEERIALQDLFIKNPDAKDFAKGIADVVKGNPGISWENAYKLAKFDTLQTQSVQTTQQNGQQLQTLKTQVMAGSGAPTTRAQPDLRSIVKDRSVPFAEVTRMLTEALGR